MASIISPTHPPNNDNDSYNFGTFPEYDGNNTNDDTYSQQSSVQSKGSKKPRRKKGNNPNNLDNPTFNNQIISLEEIGDHDFRGSRPYLSSPRSIEICRSSGVTVNELVPHPRSFYR